METLVHYEDESIKLVLTKVGKKYPTFKIVKVDKETGHQFIGFETLYEIAMQRVDKELENLWLLN